MSGRGMLGLVAALLIALLLSNVLYVVKQTERAVLLRFGEIVNANISPGLHVKWPVAERVMITDARVRTADAPQETFYTLEKKPLIVDSFVKFRVADVAQFYEATNFDPINATRLLQERVNTGLRNQIGRRDMHEVISGERDELMAQLTKELDTVMRPEFGMTVIDVRVKRIDLPPEVSDSVYRRMRSEREIEARQYRATGEERARGIRADAERQTVVIAAQAYREAEQLRGDGDAVAANTYANAYERDGEFYEFYRSLAAYRKAFASKSDIMLLDPKGEFFKFLKDSGGGR